MYAQAVEPADGVIVVQSIRGEVWWQNVEDIRDVQIDLHAGGARHGQIVGQVHVDGRLAADLFLREVRGCRGLVVVPPAAVARLDEVGPGGVRVLHLRGNTCRGMIELARQVDRRDTESLGL